MRFYVLSRALTGALVLAYPIASMAQEAADGDQEVAEIVISGGRTPVDAHSYARAATIITGEELEQRQVRTVIDALRQVPGVHVSRQGGPGGQSNIRIRGSESNHTLVLIDGIETANSADAFDFGHLDVSHIARIEVLRGPQSALYGAGATAGVINIITKGGVRNDARAEVSAQGSTAPGGKVSALMQAGSDFADIAIGAFRSMDEGWDISGDGGEKDGAQKMGGSFKATWDLTSDIRLRGVARYTHFDHDYDETAFGCGGPGCYVRDGVGRSHGESLELSGAADFATFGGAAAHTPRIDYASRQANDDGQFGASNYEYSTLKAGHQIATRFGREGRHALTGAVEYKLETFENSFASGDVKERDQYGVVLDYQGDLTDAWFVQLGARYDRNEDFEDALAWSVSSSYRLFETGTRFHASVGRAQTNPTFFELFGFIPGAFVGNPGLTPERNFGFDLGVEQRFFGERAKIDVTYFRERLEDEIAGSGLTVSNLDSDSERQGIEVSAMLTPLDGLTIGASYTFLDASEPDGATEVRRPEHSAGANIAYRFLEDRATIGADVTYNGANRQANFGDPSFASPRVGVDGYLTVDLNASFAVADGAEVFGTVKNLFDAENEDVLGYAGQPLTAGLGVKVKY